MCAKTLNDPKHYQQHFRGSYYAFNFVLNYDLLACYFKDYSVCMEQITGAFNETEEVVA